MNENFETLHTEARAHFDTGRYPDAAKVFEHLCGICISEKKFNDLVYFVYRAGLAWIMAEQEDKLVKLYQRYALIFMKHSTRLAFESLEKSTSIIEKLNLFDTINRNLQHLNKDEERQEIIKEQIKHYELAINAVDDFIMKKDLIDRLLTLLDNKMIIKKYTELKAEMYEKEGDSQLKNAEFDPESVANKLYKDAIVFYNEVENTRRVNRVMKKIKKLAQIPIEQ